MPARIYLDHAASTPLDPAASAAMAGALLDAQGNPSSLHEEGRRARALLDDARARIAAVLRVRPREIVFTSGGTEALDLGLRGAAGARSPVGRRVVVTGIEHPAVLEPADALRAEGFDVVRVPPRSDGTMDVDALDAAATPGTTVLAVMGVNHETGVVLPVREIAARVRPRGVALLCDGALLPGFADLAEIAASVDLLALSGHKLGGPKGIGVLVVRRGTRLVPRLRGGPQEDQVRGGTENVLGAVGFAIALEVAQRERASRSAARARARDRLAARLTEIPGVRRVGRDTDVHPAFLVVEAEGCEGEALLIHLDLAGVAVSTGSACAIGAAQPSPVLLAMGFSARRAASTIRFSTGASTTDDEVERVTAIFSAAVGRLRALAR